MEGNYGFSTSSYNMGGTVSDERTITNSLFVNANLSLDLSKGTWGPSSGGKWSESTMTDTTTYQDDGRSLLTQTVPSEGALYTSRAHEHGTTKTVITQIQAWTVDPDDDDADDDGWAETTNYNDNDVTSENYFDFTANNSFRDPSLAPPNKGGIYTMHIDSDTSSEVDAMTSDGTNTLTKTYWGQGKDSYNNVSMGFNLSDSWSMSKGGLNQLNGSETGAPNYEGTSAAPGFIGEVLMDYGDYYAGFTGPAGNGSGLVTPNISSPGSNGTLAPPYNVPPEVIPSTNLGPEAAGPSRPDLR